MKNSSKTMYKIGRIFSYVLLGLAILWCVLSFISILKAGDDVERASAISNFIMGILYLGAVIVTIILASKALAALENNEVNKKEHITMIVVGAISSDIFYFLGGIFGLIAESQEEKPVE